MNDNNYYSVIHLPLNILFLLFNSKGADEDDTDYVDDNEKRGLKMRCSLV